MKDAPAVPMQYGKWPTRLFELESPDVRRDRIGAAEGALIRKQGEEATFVAHGRTVVLRLPEGVR